MSSSNIPSAPIDNTALITDIVNQVNTNTDTKATNTQAVIVADGDATQAQLSALTLVNGDISTDVQAINAHVTTENDRVLANIPSNSPIKSIQRGSFSNYSAAPTVTVSAVDVAKSVLLVHSKNSGSSSTEKGSWNAGGKISNATTLIFSGYAYQTNMFNYGTTYWELIEYV